MTQAIHEIRLDPDVATISEKLSPDKKNKLSNQTVGSVRRATILPNGGLRVETDNLKAGMGRNI